LTGGGSVSVKAGRDVVGSTAGAPQPTSAWTPRFLQTQTGQLYWGNRYDKYLQGFATFGGGYIDLVAGRDAWQVNADVSSSGYVSTSGSTVNYGGGSVRLTAGRDVIGGAVAAYTIGVEQRLDLIGVGYRGAGSCFRTAGCARSIMFAPRVWRAGAAT